MLNDYPQAECKAISPVQESKRDYLVRLRQGLMSQIADIDRCLVIFEKNPEIEELTNILRRL